jgi:diguanylate cyclase (GGDEF)-like protein
MGVLLAGYVLSLVTGVGQSWPIFNDWAASGFESVGGLLCMARGLVRRQQRAVSFCLGLGLLMWSIGDFVLTVESQGGRSPATPSAADAFYLAFFPLSYIAVALTVREQLRKTAVPTWLDGAIAGLGASALCSAFVFSSALRMANGSSAAALTNIAYPTADLLLLSMVVGGSTVISGNRRAPWMLLAAGMAVNLVGDSANVFSDSLGHTGFVLDAMAWPASTLLLAMAVWVKPRSTRAVLVHERSGFLIPGLSAACALAVLVLGSLHHVSRVAIGLAAGALLLGGLRLVVSIRGINSLSQERRQQSVTDELTGLGNRRWLFTVLDSFFADYDGAASDAGQLAFLFLDLNGFKEINDTFGHPAGDQLLRQLGPRLRACLRQDDALVRLGGDEFVVVLPDTNTADAIIVAQRLADSLADPFSLDSMPAKIGVSIGIAHAPTDATDSAALLWCADTAMYRAKLSKAPYVVYRAEIDAEADRLLLVEELRVAIEQRQLALHYQPLLDLRTGHVSGAEALLRWDHPRLGPLPPLEFLPVAEDAGLMGALTTLVLDEALAQCSAWWTGDQRPTVSVNISASDLLTPLFAEHVHDALERHNLPASALVLEITETTMISDFAQSQQVIRELRDLGVVVSVDDFGAGFTSLGHLSSLSVKELKLDRVFITEITEQGSGRALDLVRATIALGHALGLRIVAEGIEDRETLELLADLGCDLGQGYFIGRPGPAEGVVLQPAAPRIPLPRAVLDQRTSGLADRT